MAYSNVPFVIALFVQALMYGLYITTLAHCLRWLLYDDKGWKLREKINWAMVTITIFVFIFFTTGLGVALQITIGEMENEAKALLETINLVGLIMENVTMLVVDAVLVYRCWVVYNRSWRIVLLPVVLWFGVLVCSIIGTFALATSSNIQLPWVWVAFFLCNIILNVYATSAIIYRILRVVKETGGTSRSLHNTSRILAESGILYTISSILNLSVSLLPGTPQYFVLKLVADVLNFSMMGITFNLILIRVGQNRAGSEETHICSPNAFTQPVLSTLRFCGSASQTVSINSVDAEMGKTERIAEAY